MIRPLKLCYISIFKNLLHLKIELRVLELCIVRLIKKDKKKKKTDSK